MSEVSRVLNWTSEVYKEEYEKIFGKKKKSKKKEEVEEGK